MNRLQARAYTRPFHPFDLGAAVLNLHMSAMDHGKTNLMVDGGAGLISSWKNRVNGLAFTAPADTTRPTWSATGQGGLYPAVVGDGVNDCLTAAATTDLPTGSNPSVVIALVSAVSAANGSRIFEYGVSTALQNRRMSTNGVTVAQASNGTTSATTTLDHSVSLPFIHVGSWATGLTEVVRADGGAFQTTATMTSLATATTRARLFAATGASATGFGAYALSELFVLTGSIATLLTAIQKLEGWIAWQYPLLNLAATFPADHPYKFGPP